MVQTITIYIAFIYLLNFKGPDQAFSLILPVSTGLSVFYLLRDGNVRRSISRGYFSVISIVVAAITLLVFQPPKLAEWYTIFLLQSFREELFFRFFMLGLFGKWFFSDDGSGLSIRSMLLLMLNSVFFATVHAQYSGELASLVVIFILGMLFSYVFAKMGLLTSIILHAVWNIYLPIRWPAIIFFLGLFVIDIVWYREHVRKRGPRN